ncbi:hypothetical protein BH20ACT22_BH20ACT22_18800 [soil metagenome]
MACGALLSVQTMKHIDRGIVDQLLEITPLVGTGRRNPFVTLDDLTSYQRLVILFQKVLKRCPDQGRPRYTSPLRVSVEQVEEPVVQLDHGLSARHSPMIALPSTPTPLNGSVFRPRPSLLAPWDARPLPVEALRIVETGTMQHMVPGQTEDRGVSQMRRGTLEYCVLAILRKGERYGFELVKELSAVDGMVTTEGTIYPLLTRLRKDGLLTSAWKESTKGPPRRYYHITAKGTLALEAFAEEWKRFRASVDRLMEGESR